MNGREPSAVRLPEKLTPLPKYFALAAALLFVTRLEHQLDRQLDLTWAVSLTSDCTECSIVHCTVGTRESHTVEGIEHFSPELDIPFAFVEEVILEQRQVEVFITILPQVRHHTCCVAKREGWCDGEITGVEPFQQLVGFAGVLV